MVDRESDTWTCKGKKLMRTRDKYDVIQAVANLAVVIALIFTISQYMTTIIPTKQEQSLIKAQALFNSGQFSEAVQRYNSSLLQKNPIALNNLGYMHERGLYFTQDNETAKYYYRKASAEGSEIAVNNLIRLDLEEYSAESKEDLVRIFRSAYEMKNDKLIRIALSIIDANIEVETVYDTSIEGEYSDLFTGNAEKYAEILDKTAMRKEESKWISVTTFYSPVNQGSMGGDTKLVFGGTVSGANIDGGKGTYYKYTLYRRDHWNLDDLECGMEKVYITK